MYMKTACVFPGAALVPALIAALGLLLAGCQNPAGENQTLARYTITFDARGGTEVDAVTADEGTAVAKPADPARSGYVFDDWHDAAEGGAAYTWPHALMGNITMYAQWRENTQPPAPTRHTITFDSHGGSETPDIRADEGTAVAKPADPALNGFIFQGWFSAPSGGTLYSWPHTLGATITMHAQWREEDKPPLTQYTIAFDSHGGSEVAAIRADEGTELARPADPTRNGYAFAGWHSAAAGGTEYPWPHALAADLTMHARWTAISYAISYNPNGGANAPENPAAYTVESAAINLAAPIRAEYNGAWHDNEGLTGDPVATIPAGSTGNKTFYAKWTLAPYVITYVLNGGTNAAGNPATYTRESAAINLAAASRNGCVFGGWYDNAGLTGNAVAAIPAGRAGNKTLYAKWTVIPYDIFYNLDGGVIPGNPPRSYTVEDPAITLPTPRKNDYSFGGWFEDSGFSGTAVTTIAQGSFGNKTFYAQWWPDAPVSVSVWVNEDGDILASNDNITISKSGASGYLQSFTAGVTSAYTGVQWTLSGVPIAGNTASVVIKASDYTAQKAYILGVVVTKDGIPYSKDITFTVVN
jgi:uncharacterized repeat protein (TIGR02543 family)